MFVVATPAKIEEVGISGELGDTLYEYGIETVPQLTAQTEEGLCAKIGSEATSKVVSLLKKKKLSLRAPNSCPGVAPADARRIAAEAMMAAFMR